MVMHFKEIFAVSLVLFSVIDILGSLPVVIDIRNRAGGLESAKTTIAAGTLMVLFLFGGEMMLHLFGTDVSSFALAGALVIFAIGVEMILGIHLFRDDAEGGQGTISYVPLAFPLIAGAGTLTTILTLKAEYEYASILIGIALNLIVVFGVLRFCGWFEKRLGKKGLAVVRKVFGIVLLSIAVKIFKANLMIDVVAGS